MRSFKLQDAAMPCRNCIITWMKAGLTYENGSEANAETGLWLHHVVLTNRGKNRDMRGCGKRRGDRFFASGNERTEVDLGLSG
jgi:hypothetical protein